MATGRALTTDTDREYLAGEAGDQRKYEARSRVKARITGPLVDDIAHFAEHAPGLLEALQDVVCEDGTMDSSQPEQTLKRLSQELDTPITVGETVYEDGDRHQLAVDDEGVTDDA